MSSRTKINFLLPSILTIVKFIKSVANSFYRYTAKSKFHSYSIVRGSKLRKVVHERTIDPTIRGSITSWKRDTGRVSERIKSLSNDQYIHPRGDDRNFVKIKSKLRWQKEETTDLAESPTTCVAPVTRGEVLNETDRRCHL